MRLQKALCCLLLGVFLSVIQTATAAVRISIFESIPDDGSWNFKADVPSETFSEKSFAFGTMPARYSGSGIRTDRSAPFLYQASGKAILPKGTVFLLLRAKTGARLFLDGQEVLSTPVPDFKADGHEEVPESPKALSADIRYLRPGHAESLKRIEGDGREHEFQLEALIGLKGRRPELGEMSVAFTQKEGGTFQILGSEGKVLLTEDSFGQHLAEQGRRWKAHDTAARRAAVARESGYWNKRHETARKLYDSKRPVRSIDEIIEEKLKTAGVRAGALTDDYAFIRRLSLDTIGTIPPAELVKSFVKDPRADKRARLIERFLEHPGWADHWVSYWQDVLAENPGILKPTLNNTGPFRWWIYESFLDNKPMDQFAAELIMMEGSKYYGGPAGFGMATDNDVPMAQKAQIIGQAFLGMQMQCARCHDAPHHEFKQRELFSLAAMLKRGSETVPWSSSIPTNSHAMLGRKVKVTLPPGSKVAPEWPFARLLSENDLPAGVLRKPNDPREKLAALVTDPRNPRFARVLANRLWKRYLGWGLVEPVDDWETAQPSHAEILDLLAAELTCHDYDLKHLAKLILNSNTYQREATAEGSRESLPAERLFAAPARRRLSAEQIVDSLFAAAGKSFGSEELNLDIDSRRPVKDFNNLGIPARAWEFTSLSNERDRPALSLPRAQGIVDTLATFGWRDSRQNPISVRDDSANVVQPAILANGVLGHGRIARFSDESAFTQLALQEKPVEEFVEGLFLSVLSRRPTAEERKAFVSELSPGYQERRSREFGANLPSKSAPFRAVSWANHLNPEATKIKQEQERAARAGDAPSLRLQRDWRERAEDAVWALVNSPEFIFVP